MSALSDKIKQHITIDTSGGDQDRIAVRLNGITEDVTFSPELYQLFDSGSATLPDGTLIDGNVLQLAFQDKLIEVTGMCVLEHDYVDAGFPELAELARSARGVSPGGYLR